VQLLERHFFLTEIDGVCETLNVGASVALDDSRVTVNRAPQTPCTQAHLKNGGRDIRYRPLIESG
jgi:hypothetical protein